MKPSHDDTDAKKALARALSKHSELEARIAQLEHRDKEHVARESWMTGEMRKMRSQIDGLLAARTTFAERTADLISRAEVERLLESQMGHMRSEMRAYAQRCLENTTSEQRGSAPAEVAFDDVGLGRGLGQEKAPADERVKGGTNINLHDPEDDNGVLSQGGGCDNDSPCFASDGEALPHPLVWSDRQAESGTDRRVGDCMGVEIKEEYWVGGDEKEELGATEVLLQEQQVVLIIAGEAEEESMQRGSMEEDIVVPIDTQVYSGRR